MQQVCGRLDSLTKEKRNARTKYLHDRALVDSDFRVRERETERETEIEGERGRQGGRKKNECS